MLAASEGIAALAVASRQPPEGVPEQRPKRTKAKGLGCQFQSGPCSPMENSDASGNRKSDSVDSRSRVRHRYRQGSSWAGSLLLRNKNPNAPTIAIPKN